jgi:hypothetical protein
MLTVGAINAQSTATKTKCTAMTTKGIQCKNTAEVDATTCRIHSSTTPRCGATTSKGQPCKMIVATTGEKCWRHKQ